MIVLDTHIWFWFINQEYDRFPHSWQQIIETTEVIAVSVISCIEVALAQKRRRLILPCPAGEWIQESLEPSGISLLALTPSACAKSVDLTDIHRDPFDRLIMASTIERMARLATLDGLIRSYPEMSNHLLV